MIATSRGLVRTTGSPVSMNILVSALENGSAEVALLVEDH